MRVCPLPSDPSLELLKSQARTLQRRVRAGEADAVALVAAFHPRLTDLSAGDARLAAFRRADAQLTLARRHGFASWRRLRQHLEVVGEHARSPHRPPAG